MQIVSIIVYCLLFQIDSGLICHYYTHSTYCARYCKHSASLKPLSSGISQFLLFMHNVGGDVRATYRTVVVSLPKKTLVVESMTTIQGGKRPSFVTILAVTADPDFL